MRDHEATAQAHGEGWIIRNGRISDVEAILDFWRKATATPSATDTARSLLQALGHPTCCVLVAEAEEQIVGTAIGGFDGWRGNIYRLAVHPAWRRRGCARALVEATERCLLDDGARRISALVVREHRWATAFWEDAGYDLDARMARYVRTPRAPD